MPSYSALDTRSITAMNGSQGYDNDRFIEPRQAASESAQRIRSFRREQSPFHIRNEDVTTSRRRMGQQLADFDRIFGGR